jgi:hypothetical protein
VVAATEADANPTDDERASAMPTVDQVRPGGTTRPATLTCTVDGRDHLISEQATTAGLVAGHGKYVAVCGRVVVAAPLVAPQGPTCMDCETALHRITTCNTNSYRHRRLLAWLPRRPSLPADSRSTTKRNHRAGRR